MPQICGGVCFWLFLVFFNHPSQHVVTFCLKFKLRKIQDSIMQMFFSSLGVYCL